MFNKVKNLDKRLKVAGLILIVANIAIFLGYLAYISQLDYVYPYEWLGVIKVQLIEMAIIWIMLIHALKPKENSTGSKPRRGLVEVERPETLYGEYIPREEDPKEIWVKRPMIETYIDGVGRWVDRDAPRLPKKKNQDVIYLPDLKN